MLKPIHTNIQCSECGVKPLQGIRYRCCTCMSFNLCGICYTYDEKHDPSHCFYALKRPLQQHHRNNTTTTTTTTTTTKTETLPTFMPFEGFNFGIGVQQQQPPQSEEQSFKFTEKSGTTPFNGSRVVVTPKGFGP